MKQLSIILISSFVILSCGKESVSAEEAREVLANNLENTLVADGFDFPAGKPDGDGYYDAQHFGKNNHLGEDWNGKGGGDTDLGDTIYVIANGKVSFAEDLKGGWGNVIRVVHTLKSGERIESLYAHCDEIFVKERDTVKKGQKIGTIGNAHGKYLSHLHFEIREKVGMPIGKGYSEDVTGYINPSRFIHKNRK